MNWMPKWEGQNTHEGAREEPGYGARSAQHPSHVPEDHDASQLEEIEQVKEKGSLFPITIKSKEHYNYYKKY